MYDVDPYVAQRSMELNVSEALHEASQPRLERGPASVRLLFRRGSRRLALLLVSLGGVLVRHSLPPYQSRSRDRGNGGHGVSPAGRPLA
jgi:hypothetical protein